MRSAKSVKYSRVMRTVTVAIIAIVVTIGLASCGARSSAGKASAQHAQSGAGRPTADPGFGRFANRGPIPVQTDTVKAGTLVAEHVAAGSVVPVTQSQVAAQTSGIVARVVHNAGDWVAAGDVVVQLDDSQLKLALANAQVALKNAQINLQVGQQNASQDNPKLTLQLQSAKAALASAQKNYAANEELFKSGGASASQVDTAQSQLQTAQANVQAAQSALQQNQQADAQSLAQLKLSVDTSGNQLKQAELNLENAQIRAPFSGQIASIDVTVGEFVGQNTPAFLLVSRDKEISFNVSPMDAPALAPGSQVNFAVSGNTYLARVTQSPSAPINGVVPMVANLVSNRQDQSNNSAQYSTLPYGTVGNVSYPVNVAQGTLVPIPALQTDGSETYVFTVVAGKVHRQPVTILSETSDTAAVNGLATSSTIVVSPPPGLLDGAEVAAANTVAGGASQAPASNTHAPSAAVSASKGKYDHSGSSNVGGGKQ